MSREVRLAVVGATGLVGEAVLEALAERGLAAGPVHALASERSLGRDVQVGGRELPVEDLAGFDFTRVDLAVFVATAEVASAHVPRALDAGALVVDASSAFRHAEDVPLVAAPVNGDALERLGGRRLVASPSSAAYALALALQPLQAEVGVERVNVVVLESVANAGREAVEELASQCAQLLNGRPLADVRGGGAQLAFNCVPLAAPDAGALQREVQKILGDPAIKVNATVVRVPVFFGDALAVHAELRGALDVAHAQRLLAAAPALDLADDLPTPAARVHRPGVALGRLRADPTSPGTGLDFWLVADGVRQGAALNTVDVVEVLVRKYF